MEERVLLPTRILTTTPMAPTPHLRTLPIPATAPLPTAPQTTLGLTLTIQPMTSTASSTRTTASVIVLATVEVIEHAAHTMTAAKDQPIAIHHTLTTTDHQASQWHLTQYSVTEFKLLYSPIYLL